MVTKTDMRKLGETIAEEWMDEILEYYCKNYGNDAITTIMGKLDELNSAGVIDYCENHLDMIQSENIEEEARGLGMEYLKG